MAIKDYWRAIAVAALALAISIYVYTLGAKEAAFIYIILIAYSALTLWQAKRIRKSPLLSILSVGVFLISLLYVNRLIGIEIGASAVAIYAFALFFASLRRR